MHSLLHDIPQFLILFLEELFLIFHQMLNIRSFGRRDDVNIMGVQIYQNGVVSETNLATLVAFSKIDL